MLRADLSRDSAAAGNADADAEVTRRILRCRRAGSIKARRSDKGFANAYSGAARALDRVGLRNRPAPKAHRGVAVEIANNTALLQNMVRHDAERLTNAAKQSEQVASRAFAFAG